MKKYLSSLVLVIIAVLIAGCGSSRNSTLLQIENFSLLYRGSVELEQQILNPADQQWIIAIFQENRTNEFWDSLIAVESYNQWKGVNVFSQESITTLEERGLTIENLKTERFLLSCSKELKSSVVYSYFISSGFSLEIPQLYMTQLFIENGNNIVVFSHSTTSSEEQQQMLKSFTAIYCS